MIIEVRVPNLPESVADATLVKWHKKAGEAVSRDQNLADLETDKVVLEVPATAGGVLKEILVAEGTVVVAGQVLALLEEGAVAVAPATAAPAAAASASAASSCSSEGTRCSSSATRAFRRLRRSSISPRVGNNPSDSVAASRRSL